MWLILALVALPLIEIALFVVVGGAIGLWATLVWVVLSAVLGFFTLRWVARLGPISFDRDVKALRDPMSPIAGRALTILAGVLLILPGFFTDTIGLLLLLQPVQGLVIRILARRFGPVESVQQAGMTIDGDWTEASPAQTGSGASDGDAVPPSSGLTRH
jgi:UPF0716 protein FxsA